MNAGSKFAILILLSFALGPSLCSIETYRIGLIVASTAVLAFSIFSFGRAHETAAILTSGIVESFSGCYDENIEIDLIRFGRHTRYFIAAMSATAILFWLGIRVYVSMWIGLLGAILVFAEFVLNFEVLGHLISARNAAFSNTNASRIVYVYRFLSIFQIAAAVISIALLLMK